MGWYRLQLPAVEPRVKLTTPPGVKWRVKKRCGGPHLGSLVTFLTESGKLRMQALGDQLAAHGPDHLDENAVAAVETHHACGND